MTNHQTKCFAHHKCCLCPAIIHSCILDTNFILILYFLNYNTIDSACFVNRYWSWLMAGNRYSSNRLHYHIHCDWIVDWNRLTVCPIFPDWGHINQCILKVLWENCILVLERKKIDFNWNNKWYFSFSKLTSCNQSKKYY